MSSNQRAALIIGNGKYKEGPLTNPPNDATAIDGRLQELGFQTMAGLDLDREGIFEFLGKFKDKFNTPQVALLYYAGHGLQYKAKNYLVPVDAKIRGWIDIDRFGIDLDTIFKTFGEMVSSTEIFFLDCCRNNPFLDHILANTPSTQRDLTVRPGLAGVHDHRTGTFIAYATGPDKVAEDGKGDHSPFTQALLKHMGHPGLSISDMMIDVTNEVLIATNNQQEPICFSKLRKKFFFKEQIQVPVKAKPESAAEAEWLGISASNSISVFEEFVRSHPKSKFRKYAKARIEELRTNNATTQAVNSLNLPADHPFELIRIRPFNRTGVGLEQLPQSSRKHPILGSRNMLDSRVLEGLISISLYSVAKVINKEGKGMGTAFIVSGKDLFQETEDTLYVLTAAHVVSHEAANGFGLHPDQARILFEGLADHGVSIPPIPIDRIVWESYGGPNIMENTYDATVLSLGNLMPDFARPIPIAADLPQFDPRDPLSFERPRVISVSYPYGGSVRFGNINSFLLDYDRPAFDANGRPVSHRVRLHYTAASEPGSSGCPILNESLEVIGLHQGSGDHIERLNNIGGSYAANIGIWIQSIISAVRTSSYVGA